MVLCQDYLAMHEMDGGGLTGIVVWHGRSDQMIGKLIF